MTMIEIPGVRGIATKHEYTLGEGEWAPTFTVIEEYDTVTFEQVGRFMTLNAITFEAFYAEYAEWRQTHPPRCLECDEPFAYYPNQRYCSKHTLENPF